MVIWQEGLLRDTLPTTHFNEAALIKMELELYLAYKVCMVYWYGLLYSVGDCQRGEVVTVAVIMVVIELIKTELWWM